MKNNLIIFLSVIILVSCKTNELYLNVVEPAPVQIPSSVQKIGIINRYLPSDETRVIDAIDKTLSLEGKNLDKDGSAESVRGLADELSGNVRFASVVVIDDIKFKTSSFESFPAPLKWEIVDMICSEKNTDALFALERYDTDTHVNYSSQKVEMKTPLGNIPGLEHQVDMQTVVQTGWRIYYPSGKAILDEYAYDESIVFTGKGVNPLVAAAGLIGRKDAVNQVSNKAGHEYALRILPYQIRVSREYYVKGTNNFKIARRRAQLGKWDEAGELWEKETNNSKGKIAGRACYNMAIINEINGDFDSAIGWAQKAYEDYNNKLALDYVRVLENRRNKSDIVNAQ
jgi:tetratricopeptide (TPR) repeat protein